MALMQTTSGGYAASASVTAAGALSPSAYSGMWQDLTGAALEQGVARLREIWRANALYRLTLEGPMPDRVQVNPEDLLPRRLEEADAMFRGRFRLPGGTVTAKDCSIFDMEAPNEVWAEEMHSFGWVRHLAAAGGDAAAEFTRKGVGEWLERYSRGDPIAWRPHVTARRLTAWCAHAKLVLSGVDILWRSHVLRSMANQAKHLMRTVHEAPDGEPRLIAAIGLAVMGVALPDGAQRLHRGLEATIEELDRQVLADGGHISRNPEALLRCLLALQSLAHALKAQSQHIPDEIRSAIDRMGPMVRFFRMGDGRLAVFNGGGESTEKTVDAAVARDEARGKPFAFAPHSQFHRLTGGPVTVLLDAGGPPPPALSTTAHAGALSFEMSVGKERLIVNCGTTLLRGLEWAEACRATAGHSTLAVGDMSSASILQIGMAAKLLGPRMLMDGDVESRRQEEKDGTVIEAVHRGYLARVGLIHERRVKLLNAGDALFGEDMVVSPAGDSRARRRSSIALRFHIHPDVRASLAQDATSVMLLLPSGAAWRFQCDVASPTLEESVYLGWGDGVRRTEQIVVTRETHGEVVRIRWSLREMPRPESAG